MILKYLEVIIRKVIQLSDCDSGSESATVIVSDLQLLLLLASLSNIVLIGEGMQLRKNSVHSNFTDFLNALAVTGYCDIPNDFTYNKSFYNNRYILKTMTIASAGIS